MSLLEILQLIGYSMAATLPLWLGAMLFRRRHLLSQREKVLLALAFIMGAWHASNLAITLHGMLGLDHTRWSALLRLADTVAVVSITLTYSLLLHVHLHLWADARRRPLTRLERVRVYLSYIPALFLCVTVPLIWSGEYAPMVVKLGRFVWPFALWASYVLCLTAATDLLIARQSTSASEKSLMRTLAASFLLIVALILAVYAFRLERGTPLGLYLQTFANLGSLLPTALLAYYIYRYRYLELIVRESLIVASFAAVVIVVYLYGIRTFGEWLTARYQLRAGAVETLLILSLALVAAPLRRWLDRRFRRLFEREASLYRDMLMRVGASAARYRELPELLAFAEQRIADGLNLRRVQLLARRDEPPTSGNDGGSVAANGSEEISGSIHLSLWEGSAASAGSEPDAPERREEEDGTNELAETHATAHATAHATSHTTAAWAEQLLGHLRARGWEPLEGESSLRERGFEVAYALSREERVVGLMLVDAAPDALTYDVRAVLEILAGQIAIAIEDCRLVEENVQLERRLAQGERLAALGQMAATVAHEVKNPLSAIKSIAQVMREDEHLSGEYTRDLDLIVGETDRLNRSVTQLLNFARSTPPAESPRRADEVVQTTVALFRAEASSRGVRLECDVDTHAGAVEAQAGTVGGGGTVNAGAGKVEAQAGVMKESDAAAYVLLDGARAAAVRDALSNLLLNALQATPGGGRVTVEARVVEEHYLIAVTDSGRGVSPQLRERVWEPFFTTKQRGTGLGLAIVRKRMEEAGGSARLAPTQQKRGARFELRLPLSKP